MKNKSWIISFLIVSLMLIYGMHGISNVCPKKVNLVSNLSLSSLEDTHILEWNFTWGGYYHDSSNAITHDSLGNVYIAGTTNYTFMGEDDLYLAKFNSSGHFQWNRTWGGNSFESIYDIAVDSLNNVYFAGGISIGMGYTKFLIVKYDNLGNYQWNRTWGGSPYDNCFGMALDSKNNIYLVGESQNFTASLDICLVKFNSSGHYQWNRTWGGDFRDQGYDIILDSLDNIYITGPSNVAVGEVDIALIKYDNFGNYLWNRTYDLSTLDTGWKITLDSSNNIYISCSTTNSSILDTLLLLLKYDNNGTLLWDKTWGETGMNVFPDMTLDSEDNVYVAGAVNYSAETNYDSCLIKFNSNSIEQFVKRWNTTNNEAYYGIVIDSSDNIYLTGLINNDEIYLEKYSKIPLNGEPSDKAIPFGSIYLIFGLVGIAFLLITALKKLNYQT